MSQSEENNKRLKVVLGSATPRYLTVAEAARASGFSRRAVYRAIERGELAASLVCSRFRVHPDDFLAWMEGNRSKTKPKRPLGVDRIGSRQVPAPEGLRSLLSKRSSVA